jgi:hypothetical protein
LGLPEQELEPHDKWAGIVIHDSILTIVEIFITNPCRGLPAHMNSRSTKNSAKIRASQKIAKYKKHRMIDDTHRVAIPFVVEFFAYQGYALEAMGKGYAAVQFRRFWFQQISCALQRMHAVSYIKNLSIARNEMRPSGLTVSAFDYEEVDYYVNPFGFSRCRK